MTAAQKRRFALVLLLFVAPLGVFSQGSVRTRVSVKLLARKLRSPDQAVRARAREDLLAIGQPAIDAVFPELVAGELEDELEGRHVQSYQTDLSELSGSISIRLGSPTPISSVVVFAPGTPVVVDVTEVTSVAVTTSSPTVSLGGGNAFFPQLKTAKPFVGIAVVASSGYVLERALEGKRLKPGELVPPEWLDASRTDCGVARKLAQPGARRILFAIGPSGTEFLWYATSPGASGGYLEPEARHECRLAVPLDDELGADVVNAFVERLARPRAKD